MATVDEGFQNVLLNAEVIVGDRLETFTQEGQILHCFLNAVIIDIVGCRLGPQQQVITDVLFDKTMAIVAANDRIGQFDVLDDGLQFAFVLLGDFAAKMVVILLGWPIVRFASRRRCPS